MISSGSKNYRGHKYWEQEIPLKVTTDKVRICYYPTAGKLQISAGWKDRGTGKVRYGKTAVLDAASLTDSPEALTLLETFLNQVRS